MRAPWRTSAPIAPGGKEPVDTFIRDLAAKAEVAGFDDLALACAGVFLSLWIEKGLGLVVTGFVPSPMETITDYTPTGPEIAITIGVWALGLLLITMFYKIFISVRKEE